MSNDKNNANDDLIYCPILKREISIGYCWELCNIGTDKILLEDDCIEDWDKAYKICDECGYWD